MNVTRVILSTSVAALLAATPLNATSLTWDLTPGVVGVGDGTITGGTGTWDTTTGNWTSDGGANDVAWNNANNDQAIFDGTAGTVTLGTAITANSLTFNVSGYTVTGNTLTLGGTAPTIIVAANQAAAVSSVLAGATGTTGLTVDGGGNLTLNTAATFTGGTTVNTGTLTLNTTGGVGAVRGVLTVNAGARLVLSNTDALGFNGGGVCVTTLNINGGTVDDAATAGNFNQGFITNFVLTGGTVTSTSGGAYNFNASASVGINSNASAITSAFNAPITIRNNTNLNFNVALGTTATAQDLRVTGIIGGGAGAITKNGNGVMTLEAQNTYTGGTTVNGGVLDLLGTAGGTGIIRGTANVNTGATLRLSTADAVGFTANLSLNVINLNGGTLNANIAANQTFSNMNVTMNAGTISGIAGSNIDLFNNGTVINVLAASASSVISVPTVGLRQNDTPFNVADGSAAVDLLVSGSLINNSGANNQGNHNLVKNGNGVMQLTGNNTYTGTTRVNAGTLALSGAGALASPTITIVPGALFDVSGLSAGSFALTTAQVLIAGRTSAFATDVVGNLTSGLGSINIAGSGTAGTMTVGGAGSGNVTLNGGAVNFDLSNIGTAGGGVNDLLKANNLTLTGTTSIAINKLTGALASTTYTLINYTGTLTGNATNLVLSGAAGGTTRQIFTLDTTTTPGAVLLTVAGNSATLTWAGDGIANVWDVATTANFLNGAVADKYFDGDLVTFDDNGSNVPAIALTGNLAPGTLTVNNTTKDYNFGGTGVITGGTGLTKNGSGTLTLTNTVHSFTGPVTVNAGTVSAPSIANSGTNSALGAGGAVTLGDATHGGKLQLTGVGLTMTSNRALTVGAGGGTLELVDAGSTLTLNGAVSLGGTLTKTGNGTLALASAVTGAGGLTVNGGVVNATAFSSFTGDLNINAGTFNANIGLANGVTTALGAGNGTRNITIGAGATMNWTVNNIFQGGGGNAANLPTITVNGGTLASTRFNVVGNLVLNNGATLSQTATDTGAYEGYQFIGTVTVGGTTPSTILSAVGKANHLRGGATTVFNVGNATGDASSDLTVSNAIRDGSGDYPGVGALQKTGAGTMELTAINSYTGATTISAGTLALTGGGRLASTAISVASGATFDISAIGGYTLNTGQSLTVASGGFVAGPLTMPTGSTITIGRTSAFAPDFTGDLTSSGTLNVAGSGTAGTLTLGLSAVTGTGTLLLSGGTVNFDLAGTNTVGGGVNDLIVTPGDLILFNTTNIAVNRLTGGLSSGAYTLITYAGNLFGEPSNLNLTGVVNGARQTFALDLATVGKVLLNVTGFAGNLTWVGDGTANVWDTTVVNWTGAPDSHFFDGDTVTFNDTGSNVPAVQLTGTLRPSSVTVNNNTKDYTFAGAGTIDGPTGIVKNGTGTLTITATNSFVGPVAINSGTVNVAAVANSGLNSPLGAGTDITMGDATHQGTLQFSATGVTATTNRILTLNAGGGAINVSDPGSNLTWSSAIQGVGNLTKTGNGTLTLSAMNTYTGTTIVNAGNLALTFGGVQGAIAGTLTINAGGTLLSQAKDSLGYGPNRVTTININGGMLNHTLNTNISIWGMTVNMTGGTFQASTAGGMIDFGTDGNSGNVPTAINTFASASTATIGGVQVNLRQANTTFTVEDGAAAIDLLLSAPVVEGFVGATITKAGAGTMSMTGAGSYTGATIINGGKLLINGTISGAVTVDGTTAILGGVGTMGIVTVQNGGTISPGNSPGILHTGGVNMNAGTTLSLEINGTGLGTDYDQLSVAGAVNLGGSSLSLSGSYVTATPGDLFFVLLNDNTDGISGTFAGLAEGANVFSTSGQRFVLTYQANGEGASFTGGNDVALMAVPEPAAALSLAGGWGLLLLRRRRAGAGRSS